MCLLVRAASFIDTFFHRRRALPWLCRAAVPRFPIVRCRTRRCVRALDDTASWTTFTCGPAAGIGKCRRCLVHAPLLLACSPVRIQILPSLLRFDHGEEGNRCRPGDRLARARLLSMLMSLPMVFPRFGPVLAEFSKDRHRHADRVANRVAPGTSCRSSSRLKSSKGGGPRCPQGILSVCRDVKAGGEYIGSEARWFRYGWAVGSP